MNFNPIYLPLIGAVSAVLLGKIIDIWLGRHTSKLDYSKTLLETFHETAIEAKKEIDDCEKELDKWKEKYFNEVEECQKLKAQIEIIKKSKVR